MAGEFRGTVSEDGNSGTGGRTSGNNELGKSDKDKDENLDKVNEEIKENLESVNVENTEKLKETEGDKGKDENLDRINEEVKENLESVNVGHTENLEETEDDEIRATDFEDPNSKKGSPTPDFTQEDIAKVEEEMAEFEKVVAKKQKDIGKRLTDLRARIKELEDRMDEDIPKSLDSFIERIAKLEAHREEHHTILKKLKPLVNHHLHNCGKPPPRKNTVATLGDGIAKYTCKPGYTKINGTQDTATCLRRGRWSRDVDLVCLNLKECQIAIKDYDGPAVRAVYSGTVSTTINNRKCMPWSAQEPHDHWLTKDRNFHCTSGDRNKPESAESVANYCRDPGQYSTEKEVWCYTMDPEVRWEKCNVPQCEPVY